MFGQNENVAVFGRFTYTSTVLAKQVTSPFAVFAKVSKGRCTCSLWRIPSLRVPHSEAVVCGTSEAIPRAGRLRFEKLRCETLGEMRVTC
jgi:hypothetical protein